ncbi:MAG: penicillin-binding protein activator [Gammaproteobacteria bacterium]|nr:penicillin-binding protein activator [Gammaproteobacteria bacterium]
MTRQTTTRPPRRGARLRRLLAPAWPAIAAVAVAGCAALDVQLNPLQQFWMNSAYEKAAELSAEGRYAQAAETLWDTADDLPSPHRERMQIKSVRALINGQYLLNAHQRLAEIRETGLKPSELLEKRILEAAFHRQTEQPAKVLSLLSEELISGGGGAALKSEALDLLAGALFDAGRYADSVAVRVRRESLLDGEAAADNAMQLWEALVLAGGDEVEEQLAGSDDRKLRAWLELHALVAPPGIDRPALERAYADWRRKNNFLVVPDAVREQLQARWNYLDFRPRNISLLLPLTGRYARIGKAIRRGFLDAHEAGGGGLDVRFHNTDQERGATELYREAIEQGAELVIGPLLKEAVDELLGAANLGVPLITLNYRRDRRLQPQGEWFQFGLLPEDDAAQVAEKLLQKDHRHILALTSDDDWGGRLYRQFAERYTELGGRIQEARRYNINILDYANTVQAALQLDESRARGAAVQRTLDAKVNFTPRIRDDISAAVLFANHEKAALIYPLLKYYYADELPVYATSHVYAPDREKILRELDGLIYCDIPFMLDADAEIPDEHPRLFALGADAYRLAWSIRRVAGGNAKIRGATGLISLGRDRRLYRQLSWARFARGKPVPLGEGW